MCERRRIRQTGQWSEAISSLYFLDTQKTGFVWGCFFPPPCFFFSSFFHLPLPRQGNRGGIIASEVQKYRLAIWREDERKTRARRGRMEGEREQGRRKERNLRQVHLRREQGQRG